jgi:hypothetical protein
MTPAELADRIESLSWTARTAADKARARRLIKQGRARITSTVHETYIGKRGIVNYEAWNVEPTNDRR